MMSQYRVFPDQPLPLSPDEKKRLLQEATEQALDKTWSFRAALGCIWFFLALPASIVCASPVAVLAEWLGLFRLFPEGVVVIFLGATFFVIVSLGTWLLASKLVSVVASQDYPQRLRQMELIRYQTAEQEANALAAELVTLLQSSSALATDLHRHFAEATNCVQRAQSEYIGNYFEPFWDAVEAAIYHLDSFNNGVQQLSQNAQRYYTALQGRNHTFPSFPVQSASLPDPSPLFVELLRIIRISQQNFQFTLVWEHRKTRQVLVAGFLRLEDAIDNLRLNTVRSISILTAAVRGTRP